MARLFVVDRNAAEDLVQEAFLRLARSAIASHDLDRASAYLRSIVLNLARDHNRRGLVSLRHQPPATSRDRDARRGSRPLVQSEDHRMVLDAVRSLPVRQRDCITLRYFEELGIDEIAGDARAVTELREDPPATGPRRASNDPWSSSR